MPLSRCRIKSGPRFLLSQHRDAKACLCADHGADRRAAAGLPGGTDEYRGGLAGGLMPKTISHSVMD